ncbi:hypothetical protein BV898_01235 [Hypsibius exemplaris]|uniref:SUEL-type lectin domain-containing protein n=1 Tax=Hypsibius exemplaris TaxID=2072580 RepID=A0A1W0XC93_HYPEX|nr:hypothetical protein BV898_01235 [Hypsibius exemplaris]
MSFRCLVVLLLASTTAVVSAAADLPLSAVLKPGAPDEVKCPAEMFVKIRSAEFAAVGAEEDRDSCAGTVSVAKILNGRCWNKSACPISVKATPDPEWPEDCKWSPRPLAVTYTCEKNAIRPPVVRMGPSGNDASLID